MKKIYYNSQLVSVMVSGILVLKTLLMKDICLLLFSIKKTLLMKLNENNKSSILLRLNISSLLIRKILGRASEKRCQILSLK